MPVLAAGPEAGSVGGGALSPQGVSKDAVQLVRAFGHARDMKARMQSPELRSANPAFARIAAMPEAELVQVIAGVFDTIASPQELADVSKLLKTPGGRLLARDYDRILKEHAGDVPVYALSLPPGSRVAVHEAGRTPGWTAMRRIGNDARYFELVLRRVMAVDPPPHRQPAAGAGATT